MLSLITTLPRYWDEVDLREANRVETMVGLSEVALRVLRRMRQVSPNIVQVCGPISTGGLGSEPENLALFARAIGVLENRGLHVFNQLPFQEAMMRIIELNGKMPNGEYEWTILLHFYKPVFLSGLIRKTFFLPLWHTSFGTRWERSTVTKYSIPIEEFLPEWLSEAA